MKNKIITILLLAGINALAIHTIEESNQDNQMYIYGKITTKDNNTYVGQIRWEDEEAFWFDHFNSSKPKNEYLKYLTDDQLEELNDENHSDYKSWGRSWSISFGSSDEHTHIFACQFGDIDEIEVRGGDRIMLHLKNGEKIKLDGGSNDIGAQVQVYDEELGNIKINWNNIDKISFMSTPSSLSSKYGEPLYGKVKTESGTYEGYIQWDHDERLSQDELDGETEDGDLSIEFGKIKSIEKKYRGCDVTLKSGRKVKLAGTNDVDEDNRGIIVNNVKYGRVDISWDEFEKVEFLSNTYSNTPHYEDFKGEESITGSVDTKDGKNYNGSIIYDLDESINAEFLNGIENEIEYFIPFDKVKKISPKNREESEVLLKNSDTLLLGDKVDVNRQNDGVLVLQKGDQYQYIPWDQIKSINID